MIFEEGEKRKKFWVRKYNEQKLSQLFFNSGSPTANIRVGRTLPLYLAPEELYCFIADMVSMPICFIFPYFNCIFIKLHPPLSIASGYKYQ